MLNENKYQRLINLLCPTCGGTQFESDETLESDEALITCVQCNLEMSKRELRESNQGNIQTHLGEVVNEIGKDFNKEIKRMLQGFMK